MITISDIFNERNPLAAGSAATLAAAGFTHPGQATYRLLMGTPGFGTTSLAYFAIAMAQEVAALQAKLDGIREMTQ